MGLWYDTCLVVEDDARLREVLVRAGQRWARIVQACGSLGTAREMLRTSVPDLMIVDVQLPDGVSTALLDPWPATLPMPTVVAISGQATPRDGFGLARLGVREFVSKPLDLQRLEDAVMAARASPPDLRPHIRTTVGHRSIHSVEAEVRDTMLNEAVIREGGNRRAAARLLAVSRQLLQHMIRKRSRD